MAPTSQWVFFLTNEEPKTGYKQKNRKPRFIRLPILLSNAEDGT